MSLSRGRMAPAVGPSGTNASCRAERTLQSSRPKLTNIIKAPVTRGQEETRMNSAIRWRIISLQAVMVVVLAAASVFAFSLGTFTTNQIKDELTAQQIYFPGKDQIKAGGALDPAE